MSEETALATPDQLKQLLAATPSKYATDNSLAAVSKVGDWLPYISIYGSNSKDVKRGLFPMGHFGLREGKTIIDLGTEVVMFVIAWRPKAMQYLPKVLNFYDTKSEEFKKLEKLADTVKQSNCGYGPEYLVWLPIQKKFATYFLGNKTGRNESANISGPLKDKGPLALIQKARLIETPEYSWHGPETKPYDHEFDMPPMDRLALELQKFNNPPASAEDVSEQAEEADSDARR